MPIGPLIVSFRDTTTAEANQLAGSLADALRDADPSVIVDRLRERTDTQDFGASLAVILGSAAVTAVAKGIAGWMARSSAGVVIEIRRKDTVLLVATQVQSGDVSRIAKALSAEE